MPARFAAVTQATIGEDKGKEEPIDDPTAYPVQNDPSVGEDTPAE